MIPKDVDLTPAFARGMPAFVNKAATIYDKSQQYVKQEVPPGNTFLTGVTKMEMLPVIFEQFKCLVR